MLVRGTIASVYVFHTGWFSEAHTHSSHLISSLLVFINTAGIYKTYQLYTCMIGIIYLFEIELECVFFCTEEPSLCECVFDPGLFPAARTQFAYVYWWLFLLCSRERQWHSNSPQTLTFHHTCMFKFMIKSPVTDSHHGGADGKSAAEHFWRCGGEWLDSRIIPIFYLMINIHIHNKYAEMNKKTDACVLFPSESGSDWWSVLWVSTWERLNTSVWSLHLMTCESDLWTV